METESPIVLLVDDLDANLLALEALLRDAGAIFLKARSGPEALEILLRHEVALALLDVQMPEMDGFQLAALMRGTERTRAIPIIFITAGSSHDDLRFHGYELGAVDFLTKPIMPVVLRSKVNVFLQLARQRAQLAAASREKSRLADAHAEAERRARESEAHLQRVMNNVLAFVAVLAPDGTLLGANRAPLSAVEGSAAECIGQKFWECSWWSHCDEAQTRLRQDCARAACGETVRHDAALRGLGDTRLWIDFQIAPLRDESGRVTHLVSSGLDITARRMTQEALQHAQETIQRHADHLEATVAKRTAELRETVQELEAFSYSIAHDMRAPLRSMLGYADLLLEEQAERLDEEGREFLARIRSSARRLDCLIQDVLNYSRIVREDLPVAAVDARALVLELIEAYPNLRAVADTIEVAENLPLVQANSAALTQVFSNLLSNAVKFVRPGQPLRVRVWGERVAAGETTPDAGGAWVRVWVEDNGIGLDPEVQPRLFQMFQRFTRPGLYEGTGIGLAIARKAVERMGGAIGVYSSPGQGSRFWVTLPEVVREPALA